MVFQEWLKLGKEWKNESRKTPSTGQIKTEGVTGSITEGTISAQDRVEILSDLKKVVDDWETLATHLELLFDELGLLNSRAGSEMYRRVGRVQSGINSFGKYLKGLTTGDGPLAKND